MPMGERYENVYEPVLMDKALFSGLRAEGVQRGDRTFEALFSGLRAEGIRRDDRTFRALFSGLRTEGIRRGDRTLGADLLGTNIPPFSAERGFGSGMLPLGGLGWYYCRGGG